MFGTLVAIIVGGVWAYRRLREPRSARKLVAWLDRQGRRPLLRPVAAVVRPLWRRVVRPVGALPRARRCASCGGRITPGGLGIELTTALAVAAVGSYVVRARRSST